MMFGGCPQGGIVTPPKMPELTALFGSLTSLINPSTATNEDRLVLVELANRLSKIDPEKLKIQLQTLDKAAPAYQFGALRKLTLPESASAQKDPLVLMNILVNDALGSGTKIEAGMQQALGMLKAMRTHNDDPDFIRALETKITNLDKIARTRLASTAAAQALKPFEDSNKILRINPMTNKPITPMQVSTSLTLLSLEEDDLEEETTPPSAVTSRQREISLDDL